MGEKDPYPSFLRKDREYNNYYVIDLKKESMTFKVDGLKVVQPLDPYLGPRYTKPSKDNMDPDFLDHMYTMTKGNCADYINPTTDGSVNWKTIQSIKKDSEATFEN
jgi:hypothetical protein